MATEIDPRSVVNLSAIDPRSVVMGDMTPPAEPRGALGEIGAGVKRGALVGLPSMVGSALKYMSEPGRPVYEAGQGMVSSADTRGQRADLSLQPEQHNAVVNALASGGEMIAPLAIPLAVGGAAALALAPLPFVATGARRSRAARCSAPSRASAPSIRGAPRAWMTATAREAARINAATTMAAQTGMGMIGGQLLGTFGRTANSIIGREGADLATRTLGDLVGSATACSSRC
jgi:hypothetical protein